MRGKKYVPSSAWTDGVWIPTDKVHPRIGKMHRLSPCWDLVRPAPNVFARCGYIFRPAMHRLAASPPRPEGGHVNGRGSVRGQRGAGQKPHGDRSDFEAKMRVLRRKGADGRGRS
jgi:hypothetical protein